MTIKWEGITVLSANVGELARFYERGLGLAVEVREEHYVAFSTHGVRLAIFDRQSMGESTHNHVSFFGARGSQAFELNFECATPDEVSTSFRHLIDQGGISIAEPTQMPWGHFAGFFADPEGNIHSLFAVL